MRLALRAFAALLVVASISLASPVARAQTPAAPSATGAAPAASSPDEAGDAVLRRVLASGCRDGVAEVRTLAARGGTPWAETVARLCAEILSAHAPVNAPPPVAPSVAASGSEQSGRGTIVSASTLYGIWVGIAVDVMLTVNSARSAVIPPLLGMAAGLGLSLSLTSEHPIDNGQAWSIITGLEYGSLDGALWAGGLDLSAKSVVTTALATGLASGVLGVVVSNRLDPQQGDVEIVRSGCLWGTGAGMLGMAALSSSGGSATTFYRGTAVAMDLGFLAGLGIAASSDVSRNRVLIIDAGTLGGLIAGGGILWLTTGTSNSINWHAVEGGALAGMTVGMLASIYLSRHMDHEDAAAAPTVGALLGRDARGRWRWGSPEPTPVLDGLGRRVIGATFDAVGGFL
jgi:hypothetical protein